VDENKKPLPRIARIDTKKEILMQIRVVRGNRKVLLHGRNLVQGTLLCYPFDCAQDRHRRSHGSSPYSGARLSFDRLRTSLEAVYQAALAHELTLRGIRFEQFKKLPVYYKGVLVGDYEADFVVEDKIILELKAVSAFHPKHEAQALNYLTATGFRLAILLNFGAESLQHQRVVK